MFVRLFESGASEGLLAWDGSEDNPIHVTGNFDQAFIKTLLRAGSLRLEIKCRMRVELIQLLLYDAYCLQLHVVIYRRKPKSL